MRTLGTLAVLFSLSAAMAEEKIIDDPQYPIWAKQKIGTTVTLKNTTDANGMKTESIITSKLLEVKPDKVVLEVASRTKVMGMEFDSAPTKTEIRKSIKVTVDPKVQEAAEKVKKDYTTTSGEETLTVSGKEYKCKWTKVVGATDGVEYEGTTWTSEDMPNLTVKMISKSKGKDINSTTTIEVTEIKVP